MEFKKPTGTEDLFSINVARLQYIERVIREVCRLYCVREIRTPIFEETRLFERGIGEGTDVVGKEMFCVSRGGDAEKGAYSLRPEGTAGVVRAFLENGLHKGQLPGRFFYIGPMFRAERPQKGRLRQFHQFGAEVFGAPDPRADAEVIALVDALFRRLRLKNVKLKINSLGCPKCRVKYKEALVGFLESKRHELCDDCKARIGKNPLRTLDCKNERCKAALEGAPKTIDFLDDECLVHYEIVKETLYGLGIAFEEDPNIVRGLDYYTKTVFEFVSEDLGAQSAIGGGGRYDGLVEELGGPPMGAVGLAIGIERLILAMESQGLFNMKDRISDVFFATACDAAKIPAAAAVCALRENGIRAEFDITGKSLKAQMKYADKTGAKYCCVLGDDELESGKLKVKNMYTGQEDERLLVQIMRGDTYGFKI